MSPQIYNDIGITLSDKNNWEKISKCFIADSAYNFVTIGNFNNGVNTTATFVGSNTSNFRYSYYYVDDVLVKKLNKPQIVTDSTSCESTQLHVTNYDNTSQLIWSNGATTTPISVVLDGYYSVSVYTDEGCWVDSDTIEVSIRKSPVFTLGSDTLVDFCFDNNILIAPLNYNVFGSVYSWSTGETSREITVSEPGIYSLTITNKFGCESTNKLEVSDNCEGIIFIPNSFTPNGDGINDELQIYGTNLHVDSFIIYTRWGEIAFESNNLSQTWNGNGAHEGIYAYTINYKLKKNGQLIEHIKSGTILLLR